MFRHLPLIVKTCWRNWRRTIVTVASIGVSMSLRAVMIALFHALGLADPSSGRLVTRNRISATAPIPESYIQQIEVVQGVRETMMANRFGGTYKDNREPKNQFPRVAAKKLFKIFAELRIPEDQRKAFEHDRTGCVIGRDVSEALGINIGDRIQLMGDIYPGDFEFSVRGIFDANHNTSIMIRPQS